MQTSQVHKNLLDYEKKVGRSLTLRTVAFTVAAIACGTGVGAALSGLGRLPWGLCQAAVFLVSMPLWLMGFFRPRGMKPEKWLPYGMRAAFGKTRLTYVTSQRGPRGRLDGYVKRGGEWDVLHETWERARRRNGAELFDPERHDVR